MAGLVSGPKAPRQPQVVYVPQPVQRPPRSPQTNTNNPATGSGNATGSAEENAGNSQDNEAGKAQKRAANLLAAQRGRTGTIRTSFRGILEEKNTRPRRKKLLGE